MISPVPGCTVAFDNRAAAASAAAVSPPAVENARGSWMHQTRQPDQWGVAPCADPGAEAEPGREGPYLASVEIVSLQDVFGKSLS